MMIAWNPRFSPVWFKRTSSESPRPVAKAGEFAEPIVRGVTECQSDPRCPSEPVELRPIVLPLRMAAPRKSSQCDGARGRLWTFRPPDELPARTRSTRRPNESYRPQLKPFESRADSEPA